jgi:hypothetical protein
VKVHLWLIPIIYLALWRLMEIAFEKYEHTIDIRPRHDFRPQYDRDRAGLKFDLDAIARRNIQDAHDKKRRAKP